MPPDQGAARSTVGDTRKDAQQFVQNIGPGQSGVARGIVRRRNFNKIAAYNVQSFQCADQLQRLRCRQSTNLGCAGPRCKRRVKTVYIVADISWPVADIAPNFRPQLAQVAAPKLGARESVETPSPALP